MTPYYDEDGITIYHGDCREVLPRLPLEGSVMVTDPPYGLNHSSNKSGAPLRGEQIAGDESTFIRDQVLAAWAPRPAVVFGSCRTAAPPIPIRAVLVWDKGGHVGMGDLSLPWKQNWEHIYISGVGFAGRRDTGVLRYLAAWPCNDKYRHPHEKPVELMRALVEKCAPLARILDPFMGSGTTLRAAKDCGREAIGIEVDEQYCELAARRLAQGSLLGATAWTDDTALPLCPIHGTPLAYVGYPDLQMPGELVCHPCEAKATEVVRAVHYDEGLRVVHPDCTVTKLADDA